MLVIEVFSYTFTAKRSRVTYKKPERGWGQGGEMTQALYAHMNNKKK
jgi:hypothetical protein